MGLSKEQLLLRKSKIFATDAMKISGLYPWADAYDVWLDKTGRIEKDFEMPPAAEVGLALESSVAELASRRYTYKPDSVISPGSILHHDAREQWAGATPDFIWSYRDREAVNLQVKCVGLGSAPQWGDVSEGAQGVPKYFQAQVQWEMWCAGLQHTVVAALIGTDLRLYDVPVNPEQQLWLIDKCRMFYETYIVGGAEHPPTPSEACREYLDEQLTEPDAGKLAARKVADPSELGLLLSYVRQKELLEELRGEIRVTEANIKQKIGSKCSGLYASSISVTWVRNGRKSYLVARRASKSRSTTQRKE